jgi:hypothetical protein
MGRPPGYQWKPLGLDSDPVPGDPQAISQEAQHLASVANTINGQIAALHKIASDQTEVGQHADKIRSSASDLAGSLQTVATRYERVSSALSGWVPELEQAQTMSIQALNEAETPYAKLNQSVVLPSGSNLTAQQKQEVQNYNNAMQQAQGQLDAAKALLNRATGLRDSQASYYAGKINQASNDSLKDGFWDEVGNFFSSMWDDMTHWVADHAGLIKDICTALEILATILAIIAIFVSGGTLLLLIGAILTGIALVGRLMLLAAGKGSILDVVMDVLALASFGMSEWVGTALKGVVEAAGDLGKADFIAGTLGRLAGRINTMWETMGVDAASRIMPKFISALAEKALPEVSEEVPRLARLGGTGDIENMVSLRNMAAIATKFSDDDAIAALADRAKGLGNFLTWNFRIGTGLGVGGPLANGFEWDPVGDGKPIVKIPGIPIIGDGWQWLENHTTP